MAVHRTNHKGAERCHVGGMGILKGMLNRKVEREKHKRARNYTYRLRAAGSST